MRRGTPDTRCAVVTSLPTVAVWADREHHERAGRIPTVAAVLAATKATVVAEAAARKAESGWRTNADNCSSGACGIPRSVSGSKIAIMVGDWRSSYTTQDDRGLAYLCARYSIPCEAWAHSPSVDCE